jgi:hypothetical protein
MGNPSTSGMDEAALRREIEELRLAAESIAEWCGDAAAQPLTTADTLRCFADILSCLVAAVNPVNALARGVEQLTRRLPEEKHPAEATAELQDRLARLQRLTEVQTWQELCPLVRQARELADQLEH